jgi:hypothetical protein
MRKTISYSRKIRVPLDSKGYDSNEYFLGLVIDYDEEDLKKLTVIEEKEFQEMAALIDDVQRKIIKEETGIKELPMDISLKRNKIKGKFKLSKE